MAGFQFKSFWLLAVLVALFASAAIAAPIDQRDDCVALNNCIPDAVEPAAPAITAAPSLEHAFVDIHERAFTKPKKTRTKADTRTNTEIATKTKTTQEAKGTPFPQKTDIEKACTGVVAGKSFFFTGNTGATKADINELKGWAEQLGLKHISQAYKTGFVNPGQYKAGTGQTQKAAEDKFNGEISEVYAEKTSGTAYLAVPGGKAGKISSTSFFWANEWPELKKGGKVDKIILLDNKKRVSSLSEATEVWWTKGGPDPKI